MPARQRYRLTEGQKAVILDRRDNGQTHAEIAHGTTIPKSTISSFLTRVAKRNSDANLPHSGRPRKTSKTHDRYIIRKARVNTKVPLALLRDITSSNISVSTIRRRLAESNIKKWRAAKRPRLTVKHVKSRLKWAREHLEWSEEQFRMVMWSDECSVEKGADPRGVWVFRRPGNHEKYLPQNIAPKDKSGGVSLMVWGCFIGNQIGPLVSYRGVNTADTYITTLRDHLLPFIETLPDELIDDLIYQQDNARIHTAKKTREWFAHQRFMIMEWPPNSPDMNPIEHLWRCLKAALHHRYPDTATMRGGPETVRQILEVRLKEVWADLGPELLDNLIKSMPRRVRCLWTVKGWHTPY